MPDMPLTLCVFRGTLAANRSNRSPEHDEVRHVATEKEPGKQHQLNNGIQHTVIIYKAQQHRKCQDR